MRATTPNQQRWIRPWPEVRKGILNARVLAACAACLAPAAWAAPCVSGTVYTAAGGPQVCTVPAGITTMTVTLIGGGGGGGFNPSLVTGGKAGGWPGSLGGAPAHKPPISVGGGGGPGGAV